MSRIAHATVDIYDLAAREWSVASLSSARWGLAGASVGQYIVFAGGATSVSAVSATVDVYDTLAGRWFVAMPLSKPRAWLAGASANGVILFGGGVSMYGMF